MIAKKKLMFIGPGFIIEANLNFCARYSVDKRLLLFPLNGPAMSPSSKGMIAAETMYEVSKITAFFVFFKNAQKNIKNPEISIEEIIAIKNAGTVGQFFNAFRIIAQMKPPAQICPSPPMFRSPDFIEKQAPVPAII